MLSEILIFFIPVMRKTFQLMLILSEKNVVITSPGNNLPLLLTKFMLAEQRKPG